MSKIGWFSFLVLLIGVPMNSSPLQKRATAQVPIPLLSQTSASDYLNRGISQFNLGNYQQAITDFDQAIKLNPNFAEAYNNRGNAYAKLNNPQTAIADYTQAIKLKPEFAAPYSNRGFIYYELGNLGSAQYSQHLQQAITDFNQAIKLNPNLADAYNGRGLVNFRLFNEQQALSDFNQAIRLAPRSGDAYSNRGRVYLSLRNYQQAIADLNQALKLNPNDKVALEYLKVAEDGLRRSQLPKQEDHSACGCINDRGEIVLNVGVTVAPSGFCWKDGQVLGKVQLIGKCSKELQEAREIARELREEYRGWQDNLPPCPCTEAEIQQLTDEFESANYGLEEYHPGAESGYRSVNPTTYKNLRPGQQCTYAKAPDGVMRLITGGSGAGTPDAYSPNSHFTGVSLSHKFLDADTFDVIKKQGGGWEEYHQTWIPNNGNNCPAFAPKNPLDKPAQ